MDKIKQREVIAEFCGWRKVPCGPGHRWWYPGQMHGSWSEDMIPDYLNSLSDMRLAWCCLDYNQQAVFGHYLSVVVFGKGLADGKLFGEHDLSRLANATAEQRARAFLMTIGKWEENTDG